MLWISQFSASGTGGGQADYIADWEVTQWRLRVRVVLALIWSESGNDTEPHSQQISQGWCRWGLETIAVDVPECKPLKYLITAIGLMFLISLQNVLWERKNELKKNPCPTDSVPVKPWWCDSHLPVSRYFSQGSHHGDIGCLIHHSHGAVIFSWGRTLSSSLSLSLFLYEIACLFCVCLFHMCVFVYVCACICFFVCVCDHLCFCVFALCGPTS